MAYRWGVALSSHKELHGYKWTEDRPFGCEVGSVFGTVKSNRVATPEVALETLEGGYCPERSTYHGDQQIEEFTPWSSSEVRFNLLPARLTLEGGDRARLTPGSDFEVEVVDLIGGETKCKYFSLDPMYGSVSPGEPGEAGQLGFNFSSKFAPEHWVGTPGPALNPDRANPQIRSRSRGRHRDRARHRGRAVAGPVA